MVLNLTPSLGGFLFMEYKMKKQLNKSQLIKAVSEDTGLSLIDSRAALDSILSNIKGNLTEIGDRVLLRGFGAYECVYVPPRKQWIPTTCEYVNLPATQRIKFRASK